MKPQIPSKTARKVALDIVTLGSMRRMRHVLPAGIADATARLLIESGAVPRGAVLFSRSRLAVGMHWVFGWMMPGQFQAFAHRKAIFERQVRESIAAGAKQVLVLGAGYDTLGWRLAPEFPRVQFFEIDHPATGSVKAKGIRAMGRPENLQLIAEDLGQRRLEDVLRANEQWDVAAPSAIVAEGLLMYLPPEAVALLLQQCAGITGSGSRLVFSYAGTRRDGSPDAGPCTWLVRWTLKAYGEPWLWSIRPEELAAFLQANRWAMAPGENGSAKKYGAEFYGFAVK